MDASKCINFGSILNRWELSTNIESLENSNVSQDTNLCLLFVGCKLLNNIKVL